MSIKASIKYQLGDYKLGACVFFSLLVLVMVCSLVGMLTLKATVGPNKVNMMMGMSSTTAIFVFIAAMNSFKENFGFHLQNGASRRTLFIARLLSTGIFCAVFVVFDLVLQLISDGLASPLGSSYRSMTLMEGILSLSGKSMGGYWNVQFFSLLFDFTVFLGLSGLGYLITVLFYRMSKMLKILVGVGIPVLLWFLLPGLDYMYDLNIYRTIGNWMAYLVGVTTGNVALPMLSFSALFVVTSGLSWLLMRRTMVR